VTETSVTPNITVPPSDATCGPFTTLNLAPTGDGTFTLSLTATTPAGNTGPAGRASYSLAPTKPAAPPVLLATPAISPAQPMVPTFTVTNPGDVSPGGLTYTCTVTETSVTPNVTLPASDVTCGPTTTVDLSATGDGDYSVSVTATDADNNATTITQTATKDTVVPRAATFVVTDSADASQANPGGDDPRTWWRRVTSNGRHDEWPSAAVGARPGSPAHSCAKPAGVSPRDRSATQ